MRGITSAADAKTRRKTEMQWRTGVLQCCTRAGERILMDIILAKLAVLRQKNNGVIDIEAAEREGISKAVMSDLCQDGKLVRVARGKYVVPVDREDPFMVLSEADDFLFSHETALRMHGLLDDDGQLPSVTYAVGRKPDPVVRAQTDVHYVPQELYELGRTLAATPAGNLVPAYDMERSICDVAKDRGSIGTDVFIEVITRYAKHPKYNEQKLYEYGDQMNVSYAIKCYLDVLQWGHGDE